MERTLALSDFERHQIRLASGDREGTIAWLQEQWKSEAANLSGIGIVQQYEPLRDDPRYVAIVRDLGLPNGYDPVTREARRP